MRRLWLITGWVFLALFQSVPCSAQMQNDLKGHADCAYCGMNRKNFARSRMLVHHQDGTTVGVCSIFCAAKDYIKNIDNAPDSLLVGDYNTRKLIDAAKAYWVMGGSKPGVMTNRPKWAFGRNKDALAFIKRYGGELIDFDEAMRASYEDVYEDMRKLKQMKIEHARALLTHSRSGAALP